MHARQDKQSRRRALFTRVIFIHYCKRRQEDEKIHFYAKEVVPFGSRRHEANDISRDHHEEAALVSPRAYPSTGRIIVARLEKRLKS
ncbi:hypothetical protein VTP01DRAFT_2108, partial [Rhizomucor pusillus]|uniref:uncharacterized protein n=1 Tax=Rhizomucor pusillus TaxID=4840 RepID=UPI00374372F0